MVRHRFHCEVDAYLITALAVALGTAACGDSSDNSAKQLVCGEGTFEKDGQCVLSSAPSADSGVRPQPAADAGSEMNGKEDAGIASAKPITCGPGTKEVSGKCVVNPDSQLACGDGTIPKDGKCTVAPPPPKIIDSLTISQLSLRNHGQLITDGGKIHQFYPVEFSIGLKYKGDAAKIPVVFALGEPPDPSKSVDEQKNLAFCLVGGFTLDHPGGSELTESIASVTLQIPRGCLGASETTRKVSPIVLIDPDETLGVKDVAAVSRTVEFLKVNDIDEVKGCRLDPTESGAKGTCQVEAAIDTSPGIDFSIADLTAESSVVVVDKCADGSDIDRPLSYRCNSSIVREFKVKRDGAGKPELDANGDQQIILDDGGKPIQETYDDNGTPKLKFVYGPADLDLDVTVITYGAKASNISDIDDADKLKPADDDKAVNNVLADHGLQIEYKIRPAESDDANAWKPLYLHKPGEQAKAGEMSESGQDKAPFEETEMVPATPTYYSHGLYVENDCGERNKDACDTAITPRTDIVSGPWAEKTNFVVRACLVPVDESGAVDAALDDNPDNNCREIPIKIVRHQTTAVTNNASSYGYNFQWADGQGSQSTLRLAWGFHSWNKLDTGGATIDNEAAINLGSNLVGYTDILKGWAKGSAYVSLVGSYYDYGISTFGIKLWGDSRVVPEFHWEKDWSVSKRLSKSTVVWAGCVPITLTLSIGGTAGLTVNLDLVGADTPFTSDEESETFLNTKTVGSTRIGLAQLAVTPYGTMTVIASAALGGGGVRVGVAGELALLTLRTPLTGRLWWGLTSLSPLTMKSGAWADMKLTYSVMSGRVYLYAENETIEWCSKKIAFVRVKYPCGTDWETFWDFTIASWSGWTWNQTLWTSPYVEYSLP